jgi:predicted nucleotidyltransferase component of viral defense system
MNAYPSKELIFEIAKEMEIHSSFVEKDWVIVRALKAAETFQEGGVSYVLGGGTSLSKGHKLIKRFSEDLDFKVVNAGEIKRSKRREIRHAFIDEIGKIEGFSVVDIRTRNEGKNCCFYIDFSAITDIPSFLRKALKIEIFFDEENIECEKKQIKTFISEYMGYDFDTELNCVAPFYTAGDKFSALMWRLFENNTRIDYTLLRHLHDLCALSEYCQNKEKFKTRVLEIFESKDKERIDGRIDFKDIVRSTYDKLNSDPIYKDEYRHYVSSMCYAPKREYISYEAALSHLQKIAEYFL